jgi:hypothetical protein
VVVEQPSNVAAECMFVEFELSVKVRDRKRKQAVADLPDHFEGCECGHRYSLFLMFPAAT